LTPDTIKQALLILEHHNAVTNKRSIKNSPVSGGATASAKLGSAAVAIGGHNLGPIKITVNPRSHGKSRNYPPNSIGADANLGGYVDYLCDLYVKYMSSIEDEGTSRGKLGKHIKQEFRIGATRTRYHIPAEKFHAVVRYLTDQKLARTPVGGQHLRRGTKLCSTFEEWRAGRGG
jgi:hypothetical protein